MQHHQTWQSCPSKNITIVKKGNTEKSGRPEHVCAGSMIAAASGNASSARLAGNVRSMPAPNQAIRMYAESSIAAMALAWFNQASSV
ncbi:hypothetical protein [Novosphingobium sp. CECT 9465]|uniref:hypothetical protein n=1 Tax=Novosphingobium sp. CECT 9465 TaxID=2829794 RepID=UPI001E4D5F4C|nr:hypothetical protein [Novosphingobium sp. CECT 9465]